MKLLATLLFFFLSLASFSQEQKKDHDESNMIVIDSGKLATKPQFIGGIPNFLHFVRENYELPKVKGLNGKVLVQFVVEKDGSIGDIKVLKDIGHGTGAEAVRIMTASPKWIPGMMDGEPVRVLFTLPINVDTR